MAASAPEFTHLHVHSEYSMLDGLSRIPEMVAQAKDYGMSALALTDHGALYGLIEFYEAAHEAGIKPILGVEAYVAPRRLTDKEAVDRTAAHLTLLVKDATGYRNLLALISQAHLDGFYYKPRIDHEALATHHEGLIALSGCPSGEVAWALRQGNFEEARQAAELHREIFGRENYYLEIQSHGLDFQPTITEGVLRLSKELDLDIVCTNDSHYTRQEECTAQDLLLCIQTNSLVDDPKRLKMYTGEHYLKSPGQMHELFGMELPETLRNTMAVAEKCNLQLVFGRLDFPKLAFVPDGESADDCLSRMCWEGLGSRYERVTPEIEERLRYELGVVRTTGFAAYILFVWDFVDFARKRGILCGPRGSAAGSIILYCLGITTIDPIAHGLTFERFLNPERIQMPDIDMDFADSRRDEVIEYVAERYGRDHVAQIVTFGRLLARAAIRDTGRALGYPLSEVDRVAKLIPALPVGMTLDRALGSSPELKQLYDEQEHIRRLIDSARTVEGITRHVSTHAAGIVVSGEPLVHHVPLQKGTRGENVILSQYEMHALETIGLLKMDFLGLTNLTLLENAIRLIEETRGIKIDLQNLPMNDATTFEMLSNADSTGVFQLEGGGMRRTLREFRPTTVHHLAAIVALYRPGPMAHISTYVAKKDGRQPITYLHPKLEPILSDTYGVIVYQDQVLQIVQAIAGYTLGQADILRRAMGKKIKEEMQRERDNFLAGARRNDVGADVAATIWEYIEPFAGYAFNRAHAYCYAYIAYQTAYLKCTYPVEYMAAMLTTQADDTDRVIAAAGECRRLGIELLSPDVNHGQVGFSVEGTGVRFGLGAVKNVGTGAAQLIVSDREANGPYQSIDDLCERVDLRTVNKRVLEALTKGGALDAFGPRERVLAAIDRALAAGQQAQRAAGLGQQSLFGGDLGGSQGTTLPAVPQASDRQRLQWEKEALGFFLSNHPFQTAAASLVGKITANTSQITEDMKGDRVTLAGAIMNVRRVTTKKQETMAIAQVEDLHGGISAVVFPRTYAANPEIWREDNVVVLSGKIEVRRVESQGTDEDLRGVPELLVDSATEWSPEEFPTPEPADGGVDSTFDLEPPSYEPDDAFVGFEPDSVEIPPTSAEPERDEMASQRAARAPYDAEVAKEGGPPPSSGEPTISSEAARTGAALPDAQSYVSNGDAQDSALPTQRSASVTFVFQESGDQANDLDRLRRLHAALARWQGDDPFMIAFSGGHGSRQLVGDELRIDFCPQLQTEVEAILGQGCVKVSG